MNRSEVMMNERRNTRPYARMCASWRKIINKEVKERATEGSKDQPPSSPLLPDRTQHVRLHQPLQRRAQRRLPQRLHQVLLRQLHRRPFTRLLARLLRHLLRRLCLRLPNPTAPPVPLLSLPATTAPSPSLSARPASPSWHCLAGVRTRRKLRKRP